MNFKSNKYFILLLLIFGYSQISKGQYFSPYGDRFILELEKDESDNLQFVESSIINAIKNNSYSGYFYDGLYGSGFDIPLTHAESFNQLQFYKRDNLNKYLFDINWEPNYRSFSVTGFSKIYEEPNSPLLKLQLGAYPELFSQKEENFIHSIIKNNIVKTLDSNFLTNDKSNFKIQRNFPIHSYDIFPQTSLKNIERVIKDYLLEGVISGYKNDSLNTKLSFSELDYNYLNLTISEVYDSDSVITEQVFAEANPFSISISEIIEFKFISDSLAMIDYINPGILNYIDFPYSLLTANFSYHAIGISYKHKEDEALRTIWLNYNEVKEILLKEQINFNLYEALFTKNLFDIFEIDNYFWQKNDYQKTKQ